MEKKWQRKTEVRGEKLYNGAYEHYLIAGLLTRRGITSLFRFIIICIRNPCEVHLICLDNAYSKLILFFFMFYSQADDNFLSKHTVPYNKVTAEKETPLVCNSDR